MPNFVVTQEIILEQEILVEADSESEASDLASNGDGQVVSQFESSWPTTLYVSKVDEEE